MFVLALALAFAPAQLSQWEEEASAIAAEDEATRPAPKAGGAEAQLFWANFGASGAAGATLLLAAEAGAVFALVSQQSGAVVVGLLVAGPLLAGAVCALLAAGITYTLATPKAALVVGAATAVGVPLAALVGGGIGLALSPFLAKSLGRNFDDPLAQVLGTSLGVVVVGAVSAALLPALLAPPYADE